MSDKHLPTTEIKLELKQLKSLRSLNVLAAAFHLALIFALTQIGLDQQVTLQTYTTTFDNTGTASVAVDDVAQIDIGHFVIGYLAIAAVAHVASATVLWRRYVNYIKQHRNPLRWVEYSVSCSLMLVALAISSGIANVYVLVAIFFASAVMNLTGLVFENINRHTGKTFWSPFVLGSVLFVMPWAIMLHHLQSSQAAQQLFDNAEIVHYVTITLFSLFPIVMALAALRVGPWRSYVTTELSYITLSFVAKSALAMFLYFNFF